MGYITTEDFSKGVNWLEDWPLITAPVGCGKTYFMLHDLPQLVEERTGRKIDSVLLLEPLNMLKEDVLKGYPATSEGIRAFELDSNDWYSSKVSVCCFGAVASFLLDGNEIEKRFDLILIDEADQVLKWSLCHPGNPLVWDWLKEQKDNGTIVVSATATPSLLLDYVSKRSPFRFVNTTPNVPVKLKSNAVSVVPHLKAVTFLRTVKPEPENKYLVYVQSAKRCRELAEEFKEFGAVFIVSKYQEKTDKDGKPLNEVMESQKVLDDGTGEEITLREYLTKFQALPPGVNVLIINDAAVCGINLKDPSLKHVIAETPFIDVAKQARGRVRHDIETFTYVYVTYRQEEEGNEVYKSKGSWRRNPFFGAVRQYEDDCFGKLEDRSFITEALSSETDNPIQFLDNEEVRQSGRNIKAASSFDVPAIFNFAEGETEKIVSAKQIEEAAKAYPIRKKNGSPYGKTKWVEAVNSETDFAIEKLSSRYHNGQKGTWYQVSRDQK